MSFQQVEGQAQVVKLLQNGLKYHKVAHAYCFAGPQGVGKRKMALELAKALNCEQRGVDACDHCRSCLQIEHGNQPELIWLQPDGNTIKIEQVRQLQKATAYTPSKERTRVIIIEQAEALTIQAANSLLKFLEEPLSPMVAILLTERVHALLPTILSRCQVLHFAEIPPAVRVKQLEKEGIPPAHARIFAHLPQGVVEHHLLEQEGFAQLCTRVIEWSKEILSDQSSALISISKDWLQTEMEKDRLTFVLDIYLLWLRDLVHTQLGRTRENAVFLEWETARKEQAYRWDSSRLLWGMETVLRARWQLAGPTQPQMVLEQMVIAMQEGSLSC